MHCPTFVTVFGCNRSGLVFTGKTVSRGGVIITAAGIGFTLFTIGLARCTNPDCKRWVRVLPLELLPYKTYGIDVIQKVIGHYLNTSKSYRKVVAGITILHAASLSHASLYRWLTGLSERILDRSPSLQEKYAPRWSAIIVQTDKVFPDQKPRDTFLNTVAKISPAKYRSERRRDQLEAVQKALIVVALLFGATYQSLQKWSELLLPAFNVAVWAFPSVFRGTSLQHAHPP